MSNKTRIIFEITSGCINTRLTSYVFSIELREEVTTNLNATLQEGQHFNPKEINNIVLVPRT